MKNSKSIIREIKFALCCLVFTCICVFGSAAAFAEGGDTPSHAIAVTASTIHGVLVSAQELAYEIMDACME